MECRVHFSPQIKKKNKTRKIELKKLLILQKVEFSYIFSKESFVIFRETKTSRKKLIFQETELSYISRKWNFLVFRESYIQNPSIVRTRSIFRTLTYLEPWYIQNHSILNLRHIQNIVKHLRWKVLQKIATKLTFSYFLKMNFFIFSEMELSSLISLEVIFWAQKVKRSHS